MAQTPVTYNETDRIWSRPPPRSIYKDDASFGSVIFQSMKNWPKNIYQHSFINSIIISLIHFQIWDDDGVVITFEQALTWAIRIAQFLKRRGLTHKDVIGIAAGHSKFLYPLGVASLMNGTPFHSPHAVLDEATLKHVFSITKPNLIFCDGNIYEKVHAATIEWQPEIYTLTHHVEGVSNIETLLKPTTTETSYQPEPLVKGGDQTVALLCSSGTTGLPKVVCISNRRLAQVQQMGVQSETVILFSTALDWFSGVAMFTFNTVLGCTCVFSRNQLTPEYIVQLVRKYKVEFIFLAPCPLSALVHCPEATPESLSSIRLFNYGGGSVALSTLQRCQELFQELCRNAMLINAYGMTETSSITFNMGLEDVNSVGKPLPGVKIRIVDEDGKSLGYQEVGEIYVHNGRPWKGYFGNPVETGRMQDPEGWFHTGDLGYFDEQNRLFVVDRKKEMCKYQGYQYLPSEIEGVISELPQVEEVCVVSIYDEEQGDAAGALVVKRHGHSISAQEIADHVARRLPPIQKQLHAGVQFTDKLPTNSNGKVFRKAAREQFVAKKGE
ncbi:hypothetical protein KR054_000854 [Drosophila jambulina]|nr:hypothetical protein KR054_000854 [Drosophila jambulina]